jgi:hypothetical protein
MNMIRLPRNNAHIEPEPKMQNATIEDLQSAAETAGHIVSQEVGSNIYYLSEHAVRRAQMRGVSRDAINLISQVADRRVRVPGGAVALSISDRARQRLIEGGLRPSEVGRTCSVVLIADEPSHTIITVEHATRRRHFRR